MRLNFQNHKGKLFATFYCLRVTIEIGRSQLGGWPIKERQAPLCRKSHLWWITEEKTFCKVMMGTFSAYELFGLQLAELSRNWMFLPTAFQLCGDSGIWTVRGSDSNAIWINLIRETRCHWAGFELCLEVLAPNRRELKLWKSWKNEKYNLLTSGFDLRSIFLFFSGVPDGKNPWSNVGREDGFN